MYFNKGDKVIGNVYSKNMRDVEGTVIAITKEECPNITEGINVLVDFNGKEELVFPIMIDLVKRVKQETITIELTKSEASIIGRFLGATSLTEATNWVEHIKTTSGVKIRDEELDDALYSLYQEIVAKVKEVSL